MRRRALLESRSIESFEPFYSEYPELTEVGLYQLTPQTEETGTVNTYIEIGDEQLGYAGGKPQNQVVTICILEDAVSVMHASLTNVSDAVESVRRWSGAVPPVKYKSCYGGVNDSPLVNYYVERLL